MATSASAGVPFVNGVVGAMNDTRRLEQFYDKLFQIRDEVFVGKHPRYKLPDSVLPKLSSNSVTQAAPTLSRTPVSDHTQALASTSYQNENLPDAANASSQLHEKPPLPSASKKPSSFGGIDPVLLTKSDDLLRAELQLKRQRIERALKDELDQKRAHFRDRDSGIDLAPSFDLTEILANALELVKPISGLRLSANGRSSNHSDSFDENSFYSSQDNGWSSDGLATGQKTVRAVPQVAAPTEDASVVADASQAASTPLEDGQIDSAAVDAPDPPELDVTNADSSAQRSFAGPQSEQDGAHHRNTFTLNQRPSQNIRTEREESEYSPPAPDAFGASATTERPSLAGASATHGEGFVVSHSQQQQQVRHPDHASLQSPTVPVIRNHIETPVAPQPARVSPLAVAKLPKISSNQVHNPNMDLQHAHNSIRSNQPRPDGFNVPGNAEAGSPWTAGRQSPAGPRQPVRNPRKRRRENETTEKPRRVSAKRVARSPARSPEPYIKEEPVSPVPFADAQPVRRRVVRAAPENFATISPRDTRLDSVYYGNPPRGQKAYRYDFDEPLSPQTVEMYPRTSHRRVEREEDGGRRVASLQYMRRPLSPGAQGMAYQPVEQRSTRAVSHAFLERPTYQDGAARPPERYYARPAQSMTPPVVDHYPARIHSPVPMGPPPIPRRVVVDSYGHKFYSTTPVAEYREPPFAAPGRVEGDPYYEISPTQYPLHRSQTYGVPEEVPRVRVAPITRYHEPRAEVEYLEQETYRPRQYSLRPTELVPVREEYLSAGGSFERQRVVDLDEDRVLQRPVVRSYSLRPEVIAHEASDAYMGPYDGVQPRREYVRAADGNPRALREISVHRPEYVPAEDRRPGLAQQPARGRYVEEPVVVDHPVEVVHEPYGGDRRRPSYRY